ncbi:MAG TPA: hypothetical protein VNB67_08295, partial [Nitrososphaeraceae archaeon]|nr:hypothetical protein [Nitrososphaeraceae archaeon]
MNKSISTLFFVLVLTFAILIQNESASSFGQATDTTTKNYSNLTMPIKNTTILDNKSKIQFFGLADQKNSSVKTVTYTP